jgi:hypothetical protein
MAKIPLHAAISLQASAEILICGEPGKEMPKEFVNQNCAGAAQNILITASDLRLGAVLVGLYPTKSHIQNLRNCFQLPTQILPFTSIPMVHPKSPAKPNNRFDSWRIH